jgi:hypothetical protein
VQTHERRANGMSRNHMTSILDRRKRDHRWHRLHQKPVKSVRSVVKSSAL